MEKLTKITFWLSILGILKLVAQVLGYEISEQTVNDLANGLSAVFVVIGTIRDHGTAK